MKLLFAGTLDYRIHIMPLMACFLFAGMATLASEPATPETACLPEIGQLQDSGGICAEPESELTPAVPEGSLPLLLQLQGSRTTQRAAGDNPGQPKDLNNTTIVYFFWGKGCPHCEEEKKFLDGLQLAQPSLEIRECEVLSLIHISEPTRRTPISYA